MKKLQYLFGVIGLLLGLAVGYLWTDWYNNLGRGGGVMGRFIRTVWDGSYLLSEIPPDSKVVGESTDGGALTEKELLELIAKADANPSDINFQNEVGQSLYALGASQENPSLVSEAARILLRVHQARPDDRQIVIVLGNAYFDIGYFTKDNESLERARSFYTLALKSRTDDADVRVDYGLTYALQNPPDYVKAIAEYRQGLSSAPTHQRTLQMLTEALIETKQKAEASSSLDRLKSANPSHPMIGKFQERIAQL